MKIADILKGIFGTKTLEQSEHENLIDAALDNIGELNASPARYVSSELDKLITIAESALPRERRVGSRSI